MHMHYGQLPTFFQLTYNYSHLVFMWIVVRKNCLFFIVFNDLLLLISPLANLSMKPSKAVVLTHHSTTLGGYWVSQKLSRLPKSLGLIPEDTQNNGMKRKCLQKIVWNSAAYLFKNTFKICWNKYLQYASIMLQPQHCLICNKL